jgi:hypothetical protein
VSFRVKAKYKFLTFAVAFISIVNCCHATPNVVGSQAIQSSGNPSAGTSLNLPTGCQMYLYGLATGGGNTAGLLSQGQSIYVNNADGYTSAELAASTNNSNNFTTSTSYHVFGGCGVSNINYVQGFYGTNSGPAATNASVTFTVTNSAMVVVLGVASSQLELTISGISNLVTDVPVQMNVSGTEALIIAHGNLTSGSYTIQETTASGTAGGFQDPNHQVDLIGVLIFSDYPSVATSSNPQIPLPAITNTNSGSGNSGSGNSGFGQWQAIGPSVIPFGSGPPGAGKLNAFAVDFANPQVMYAGGGAGQASSGPYAESGIFKTTDGGNTWTNINTGLTDPMVDVLWLDQTNPDILLAGTWFGGIFRSTDAGAHWQVQTNLGSTTAFLQVDQALYAATASGVVESTDDGETWTLIEATSAPVRALAASGNSLYAGLESGDVLFQSSPSSSWQLVLSDPGHSVNSLSTDPTFAQTAYVVEWTNYYPDLLVTTNYGGSWTMLYPQDNSNAQFHNAAQVVAIDSSGVIYAGFDEILYISTNHGATWSVVPGEHWDTRFVLPWPGQSGKFVVGSDQGLYVTSNGGNTWTGLNGNIKSSLITGLAVSGSTILTAVQDYGPLASYNGGTSWQPISGCEDGYMRFNPGNSGYAYAYTTCGFQYSTDGGYTFNSVSAIQFIFNGGHNMIGVDTMNPSTVYVVAANGIFKSVNWGVSWASLPWSFTNPSLVVVSPVDSQTIFVGAQGPELYITHNGGTTWTTNNLAGVAGYPYALDIDSNNTNIVELGMTWGGILFSTNGGSTFTGNNSGLNMVAASLSGTYVWALGFNPTSSNGMAALATANGIYLSATPGAPWTDVSGNAIPKLFTDLTWVGGDLYASTYGEGVIRLADAGLPFFSIGSPPLTTNGFNLVFHGLIGPDYAIQSSTNLIDWQTITNIVLSNSSFNITDQVSPNFNQRFYRAVMP